MVVQQNLAVESASTRIRAAISQASTGLIERGDVVELVTLAAIARQHALIIGPPGTAKSEAIRRLAAAIDGRYFEYLLGRFTEPNELFGPIDLRKLRDGRMETETTGMLPEAEFAFLDEVFLGSTAILNTLLGVLNERVFMRGHTRSNVPLRVCVGASNDLPSDSALAAFADRFLLHIYVGPLADARLEDLLAAGWSLGATHDNHTTPAASVADIDTLAAAATAVDLVAVRTDLAHAIRLLRRAGIELSDRRVVLSQRLVAAAAVLAGRSTATRADLWPLVFAVPDQASQSTARDALRTLLDVAHNPTLNTAAELASASPAARAARIAAAVSDLLASGPAEDSKRHRQQWLLRLEGYAREIDASFDAERRPPEITELRERIVALLQG